MGLPDGIRKIVENYLQYGKTFQIEVCPFGRQFLAAATNKLGRDTIFKICYATFNYDSILNDAPRRPRDL